MPYVEDMLSECYDGLNMELRQMALDDAEMLENLGVESDRERNLVFYIDNFLDDLCDEMGVPVPENRGEIVRGAFRNLRSTDEPGLADIRRAVAFSLGILGKRKVAYPNISGAMESNRKQVRDIDKWVRTLGDIYAAARAGEGPLQATNRLTEGWDPVEQHEFQQWTKYYRSGDHEKYAAIRRNAQQPVEIPSPEAEGLPEEKGLEVEAPTPGLPQQQPQQPRRIRDEDRAPADNKRRFISRIDAAKRLLRIMGPPAIPRGTWEWMYESLSKLEREMAMLRTESSMRDVIIRTANMWKARGMVKQAGELYKIAQPPGAGGDVVGRIERALTGGGAGEAGGMPPADMGAPPLPPGGEMMPPPIEGGAAPSAPEGAPPAAMEEMPPPPEPPPGPPAEEAETEKKKPDIGKNPYSGSSVADVMGVLEPLVRKIKERRQMRELSKVDMMMDGLGIVSYFPELGESIARLIETENYVTTRLEKILSKLKGGEAGKEEKGEEVQPPPTVEMPEEAALEVFAPPSGGESAPPPLPPEAGAAAAKPPPAAPGGV